MGKEHLLWIVCDVSGSMSAGGKHLLARGVARMSEQYCRLGYGCAELKLVAWSRAARVADWLPDQEFPPEMLVCEGAASAKALVGLLGEQPQGKVLLITDGFWPDNDARTLKRWKERLPPDTLRVIKAGADASPQLRGAEVFAAEELWAALDGWLEGGAA